MWRISLRNANAILRNITQFINDDTGLVTEFVHALETQSEKAVVLDGSGVPAQVGLRQAAAQGCDIALFLHCVVTGYRIDAELIDTAGERAWQRRRYQALRSKSSS